MRAVGPAFGYRQQTEPSDVISAALWLRNQPGIDPDRIGVLGVSHGGSTAAWVTAGRFMSSGIRGC